MSELARQIRLYRRKSGFLSPDTRLRNRVRLRWAFLRRQCYAVWPLYGPVLNALKEGRLELETDVTFLAGCWLSLPGEARIRIGRNVWLNGNVMLHSYELIEIGEFTAVSRGSLITDATHRVDVPDAPFLEQGMIVKGPTRIGRNVWIGNNAAILGGVTIGDRAIIGTNSVVTSDVEPGTIVGGVPARVIGRVDQTTSGASDPAGLNTAP